MADSLRVSLVLALNVIAQTKKEESVPSVRSLSISAICHATEDPEKVIECLRSFLPPELATEAHPAVRTLEGHYGNPIKIVSIEFTRREARTVASFILKDVMVADSELVRSPEDFLEGSKIYLRFSKFEALSGRRRLDRGSDTIKVVLQISGYIKGMDFRDLLAGLGISERGQF